MKKIGSFKFSSDESTYMCFRVNCLNTEKHYECQYWRAKYFDSMNEIQNNASINLQTWSKEVQWNERSKFKKKIVK